MSPQEMLEFEAELEEIAELTLTYIETYASKIEDLLDGGLVDAEELLDVLADLTDEEFQEFTYEDWLRYYGQQDD